MISVIIAGATGYTGQELIRYLYNHPQVDIVGYITSSREGKRLSECGIPVPQSIDFNLSGEDSEIYKRAHVLFSCYPHGKSANLVKKALQVNPDLKIIDLSADFRFSEPEMFEMVYNIQHPFRSGFTSSAYGLTEFNRDKIKACKIVANPGCYPTAFLLGTVPILKVFEVETIIYDAKSGISGAGKNPAEYRMFSELSDNAMPYSVMQHRHAPEMKHHLSIITGKTTDIIFTPQVIPSSRGILGNIYLRLKEDVDIKTIRDIYTDTYCSEPFISTLPEGVDPSLKMVRGTNGAVLQVYKKDHQKTILVCVCIDNLGKGASGQAVQNFNVLMHLPETQGLELSPFIP